MKRYYVYLVGTSKAMKIGYSGNPEQRLKNLQVGNDNKLILMAKFGMDSEAQAIYMEKELHRNYSKLRKRGEWFEKLSIVKVTKKIESLQDKHRQWVEEPRRIVTERLTEAVGKSELSKFVAEARARGATNFCLDRTDIDVNDCSLCLYALTPNKLHKKSRKPLKGTRRLVGHINKHTHSFRGYEGWDESNRTFLYLSL